MYQSLTDCVTLNNGVKMPVLGYGVFQIDDNDQTAECVKLAIKHGYKSIDTATIYGNEEGVGRGIKESGAKREELFITTKVWNSDQGYDKTIKSFEDSLKRLQLDYLDLYLIHWPVPKTNLYVETWKAMETLYHDGRVRAIGVSNFKEHHLDAIISQCQVVPALNQVEIHPKNSQKKLLAYMQEKGIQPEAWAPLGQGTMLSDPTIAAIAKKTGKSAAQVILRWHLQNNVVAIPKSVHEERIAANAQVFDFELSAEDMAKIEGINQDERIGPDPDVFDAGV